MFGPRSAESSLPTAHCTLNSTPTAPPAPIEGEGPTRHDPLAAGAEARPGPFDPGSTVRGRPARGEGGGGRCDRRPGPGPPLGDRPPRSAASAAVDPARADRAEPSDPAG